MKKILFIGGLGSSGGKALTISNYLTNKNMKFEIDTITPNYVKEDSEDILEKILLLIQKKYDYIYASSTGCLFALHVLNNSNISKPVSIHLINPLLYLTQEKKA